MDQQYTCSKIDKHTWQWHDDYDKKTCHTIKEAQSTKGDSMAQDHRFETQALQSQGSILTHVITDAETGVQYLLAISPNMGSGLTTLLNKDGKPLVSE